MLDFPSLCLPILLAMSSPSVSRRAAWVLIAPRQARVRIAESADAHTVGVGHNVRHPGKAHIVGVVLDASDRASLVFDCAHSCVLSVVCFSLPLFRGCGNIIAQCRDTVQGGILFFFIHNVRGDILV